MWFVEGGGLHSAAVSEWPPLVPLVPETKPKSSWREKDDSNKKVQLCLLKNTFTC